MTQTLQARININAVSPEVYEAMLTFSAAAANDLDPVIAELIKIRSSQLNNCAFCLDMHTHDARKNGENEQRITLLSVWREVADLYTEQERAALALTEEMTALVGSHGVSDETFDRAADAFSERELGQVISMITVINAWNRFGVVSRQHPPRRR